MKISDSAIERLRAAAEFPDLDGTRYHLVEKLGQGGMSVIYRIEDTVLGRQVAMKIVSLSDGGGDLAARLLREAKVIAQLEHPGIVPVHDVGTLPDGRVYYTMKLVRGQRLDEHATQLGAIPQRLRLLQRICDAVGFAHAHGVLHRDLKPQNVMVGPFGEVLVMDWGLSKIVHEPERTGNIVSSAPQTMNATEKTTAHGAVLGTPGYMAPEQERGEVADISERADIFSLGAILQFLVRGLGESSTHVARPRALAAIAQKATADLPSARYQSVAELSADLSAYLDGLPVQAYPEGMRGALWRWAARNRVWLLMVLAYLVMRTILILWRRP
jgi:eukaryotic-like serine/threonine-protein kinase